MDERIVITGCGVVAPNGIGTAAYWQALSDGKSGIKAINRFDTNEFKSKLAGEIQDFVAEDHLGAKGLRELDRTTRFLCAATKMALEDSRLEITPDNTDEVGACTGTTLSSLWNISEMDRQIVKDGPFTDAGLFAGTVINAASSWVSIKFNIQGFNTTISNSYTSSLDALRYSCDFLKTGRVRYIVLGGVESLSLATFAGFSILEFLAGKRGEEVSCPFDKRRNGIILGEGAATVILESETSALQRKAPILAEVRGVGNHFDAYRIGKYRPHAPGLRASMREALACAGLKETDIDHISAAANSVHKQDLLETEAIKAVFGKKAHKIPVSSIKSMVGESFSAAGLMQIVAGIGNIRYNRLTPTINYHVPDPECDLDYVANTSRPADIRNILINNSGPGGNNATAILSRYNQERKTHG